MPVQDTVTVGLPATVVLWAEWRYSGTCQWSDTEPASGRYADSVRALHLIRALKTRRGVYRLEGMLYCLMQQTIVKTGWHWIPTPLQIMLI